MKTKELHLNRENDQYFRVSASYTFRNAETIHEQEFNSMLDFYLWFKEAKDYCDYISITYFNKY